MQNTVIFFSVLKIKKKCQKIFDIFIVLLQSIGGSNVYPQTMFWSKNKKKIGIPLPTPVFLYKSGV